MVQKVKLHGRGGLLIASVLGTPSPSFAQAGPVEELRLGVLAHDVAIFGDRHERGADLNAEVLLVSPVPERWLEDVAPSLRWLLRPRLGFGADANTAGATSQIYASLVWTANLDNGGTLWPDGTVFLSFGFGPAYNTGHIAASSPRQLSLGSNLLFHSSLELGSGYPHLVDVGLF